MAMGLVSEIVEEVGVFNNVLMRAFFQRGGKEDVVYERLHSDVTYGKIMGPIIFSRA